MKDELKPFFTKQRKAVKTEQKNTEMNGFDRLIGKKCDYEQYKCEIQSFDYITEDKWPYDAYVTVRLKPCNWGDVDENTLDNMQDGVSLGEISNIDE